MNVKTLFKPGEEITLDNYLNKCGVKDIEEYVHPTGKYNDNYTKYNHMLEAIDEIKYLLVDDKTVIDIVVDADVDGFCSASILYTYLINLNENLTIHMLLHDAKVRGLADDIVFDKIKENNPDIVIVPDAGTNDRRQVDELYSLGILYICLDHHNLTDVIQHGFLINNQDPMNDVQRDGSGALVTHKFLEALDVVFQKNWANSLIDLVALSLVSDSCDMTSQENRCYYHYGLETPDCIVNNFLYGLVGRFIGTDKYTQRDIAYKIVPKINSIVRSDDQKLKERVVRAFLGYEENVEELLNICEEAHQTQITRVDSIVRKATKNLDAVKDNNIVFLTVEEMPKTYSGLVAGKIMNITQKPTILGKVKNGMFIGSLRSPIDLQQELDSNELVDFCRGHGFAAGFGIKETNIPKLVEYYNGIDLPQPEVLAIGSYNIEDVPESLFGLYDTFNGTLWGKGIEAPVVHITLDYNPTGMAILGKNKLTLKYHSHGVDIMFFTMSKEKKVELRLGVINTQTKKFEEAAKDENCKLEILGTLNYNEYNGNITPTIVVDRYEIHKPKKVITAANVFKR